WKVIENFPNYLISNRGNIKIVKTLENRILFTKDDGYVSCPLTSNGKNYYKYVHRLVAEEFVLNPNNKKKVNNKNRIKNYNKIKKNLENRILLSKYNGYVSCSLTSNGKNYYKYVHRLVAEAFVPNPNNKGQVNHKNGIKNDNSVENLEWVTPSENIRHAIDTG